MHESARLMTIALLCYCIIVTKVLHKLNVYQMFKLQYSHVCYCSLPLMTIILSTMLTVEVTVAGMYVRVNIII